MANCILPDVPRGVLPAMALLIGTACDSTGVVDEVSQLGRGDVRVIMAR